jgi:predicted house-cleaning noncanonical NTP pyrophosphatase (MazG superfamily)
MEKSETKKVYYNKLVRDGIQAKIEGKGEACEVREITDDAEFQQELLKKVREEAEGLAKIRDRKEFLDEYADLMVALDALAALLEFSEADIKLALEENISRKGRYSNRHFLHWSDDAGYRSNETPQGINT